MKSHRFAQVLFVVLINLVAMSPAFGATDENANILKNRYVHVEMGVISYDAYLDRTLMGDTERYAEALLKIASEIISRFEEEDQAILFNGYIIDLMFVPVHYGDFPRVIEISRRQMEEMVSRKR